MITEWLRWHDLKSNMQFLLATPGVLVVTHTSTRHTKVNQSGF